MTWLMLRSCWPGVPGGKRTKELGLVVPIPEEDGLTDGQIAALFVVALVGLIAAVDLGKTLYYGINPTKFKTAKGKGSITPFMKRLIENGYWEVSVLPDGLCCLLGSLRWGFFEEKELWSFGWSCYVAFIDCLVVVVSKDEFRFSPPYFKHIWTGSCREFNLSQMGWNIHQLGSVIVTPNTGVKNTSVNVRRTPGFVVFFCFFLFGSILKCWRIRWFEINVSQRLKQPWHLEVVFMLWGKFGWVKLESRDWIFGAFTPSNLTYRCPKD